MVCLYYTSALNTPLFYTQYLGQSVGTCLLCVDFHANVFSRFQSRNHRTWKATWNEIPAVQSLIENTFCEVLLEHCCILLHVASCMYINIIIIITVCTVVQYCCKGPSKKYRKWPYSVCCRQETS